MRRIVTILGARPQFIKAAAVSRALRKTGTEEVLVHTGQHYDDGMSAVFFRELELPEPAYHLGVGSGSHGAQTGRMLEAVEQTICKQRPEQVLVYGDTNSTLAGALSASKLCIPVAHVEAGLRSFNRWMPEEINRVLSNHLADLLFAPTDAAVANLAREGIVGERVRQVGDVMYDVALFYAEKARTDSDILDRLDLKKSQYVLATVHRAENTDNADRLNAILDGLCRVSSEVPVVFPLHPRTRKMLGAEVQARLQQSAVRVTDPVGYLDMLMLEMNARVIATDSGGVQKEAFFYRVPCVTLRDETEWVELVALGWNKVVPPTDAFRISAAILDAIPGWEPPRSPYGDGHSAELIAAALSA